MGTRLRPGLAQLGLQVREVASVEEKIRSNRLGEKHPIGDFVGRLRSAFSAEPLPLAAGIPRSRVAATMPSLPINCGSNRSFAAVSNGVPGRTDSRRVSTKAPSPCPAWATRWQIVLPVLAKCVTTRRVQGVGALRRSRYASELKYRRIRRLVEVEVLGRAFDCDVTLATQESRQGHALRHVLAYMPVEKLGLPSLRDVVPDDQNALGVAPHGVVALAAARRELLRPAHDVLGHRDQLSLVVFHLHLGGAPPALARRRKPRCDGRSRCLPAAPVFRNRTLS